MTRKLIALMGIMLLLTFFAFNKNTWWQGIHSSEKLAIFDEIECSILNRLDELEEKLDDIESKLDDIDFELRFKD